MVGRNPCQNNASKTNKLRSQSVLPLMVSHPRHMQCRVRLCFYVVFRYGLLFCTIFQSHFCGLFLVFSLFLPSLSKQPFIPGIANHPGATAQNWRTCTTRADPLGRVTYERTLLARFEQPHILDGQHCRFRLGPVRYLSLHGGHPHLSEPHRPSDLCLGSSCCVGNTAARFSNELAVSSADCPSSFLESRFYRSNGGMLVTTGPQQRQGSRSHLCRNVIFSFTRFAILSLRFFSCLFPHYPSPFVLVYDC